MSLEQDIRAEIENIKKLKLAVGEVNNHLSALEGMCRGDMKNRIGAAYQRGHDDGYEAGCATAFKPVSDAEYQRGLDEAMNAFKKLYSCGWERDWKAMGFEFDEGEWSASFEFIIGHYTAAEIVEKVKAYEEKELHVGDEVIAPCGKAVVTALRNNFVDYLYSDGDCGCTEPEDLTKTGRHFDIQSILEAMRE